MTAYNFDEMFDGKVKPKEEPNNVIVETYIIQITTYPDGSKYQKIFPPKRTIKGNTKRKVKKQLQKVLVQEEEVY